MADAALVPYHHPMRALFPHDGRPVLRETDRPSPGPGEALVRVRAAALNRADLLQAAGSYPPPPGAPESLGLELAGEVVEVGPPDQAPAPEGGPSTGGTPPPGATTPWGATPPPGVHVLPGARVMALVAGGACAEYAVVPVGQLMAVPASLEPVAAAAIPEAFLTAWSNMVEIAGLGAGERVLIHAGASGVGLAATRIARALGADVAVTASAGKHAACRAAGAQLTIDYRTERFADAVRARAWGAATGDRGLAGGRGVDVVVDFVGAPYWEQNVEVLEPWGRIVFIGLLGGRTAEIDLGAIMRKRLSVFGSTLRDRSLEEKAGLVARFHAWAAPRFDSGELAPDVWRVMPMEEAARAYEIMRRNENAGKIVLAW